jgi:hypothetical protein
VDSVFAQNNFGDTASDGLAGPMGLLIIVLLAIATVLLIRNMNSRLRRLPERFPQQGGPTDPQSRAAVAPTDATDAEAGAPSDETK